MILRVGIQRDREKGRTGEGERGSNGISRDARRRSWWGGEIVGGTGVEEKLGGRREGRMFEVTFRCFLEADEGQER